MSDDQPTRDLGDPDDDDRPTVDLRGRLPLPDRTRPTPGDTLPGARGRGRGAGDDETQVIPDDLVPRRDVGDTQPIGVGDRWSRRRPEPRRAPARDRGWGRADAAGWRPLPQAGREPVPAGPPPGPAPGPTPRAARRRGQHLLVWVFTLLVALGIGAAAVLGPWAAPLNLSPQATALGVVVASLVAWVLLSALLRIAGILAFVLTPLLYLATSVPELRRLPVDLPSLTGAETLLAMTLGVVSWLAGHWFFYARKGWWRSRVAGAILGTIPGLESAHPGQGRPDVDPG
jgi:hypothetical protein